MKNTYLKVKREKDMQDVFVNLIAKKFIQEAYPNNSNSQKEVQEVNFDYLVYEGSFINKGEKEFLLQINLSKGSDVPFFSHAENFGNTTMIIIFNQEYNQISDISFHYQYDRIIDLVDINKDGILEVIIKGGYAQMGCSREWIDIYSVDMGNSLLNVIVEHNCEYVWFEGNRITLVSDYTIQNNGILLKSKLKYYKVTKKNKFDDKRKYYKTENKKDFYKFENNKFTHIDDNNNVNWDEPGLEF
jgi:hypothetical protein